MALLSYSNILILNFTYLLLRNGFFLKGVTYFMRDKLAKKKSKLRQLRTFLSKSLSMELLTLFILFSPSLET